MKWYSPFITAFAYISLTWIIATSNLIWFIQDFEFFQYASSIKFFHDAFNHSLDLIIVIFLIWNVVNEKVSVIDLKKKNGKKLQFYCLVFIRLFLDFYISERCESVTDSNYFKWIENNRDWSKPLQFSRFPGLKVSWEI